MLDLGLTKMALIGVVALVVLGPKRLPGVARTAGALFGRAQRYIDDVRAEVAREIDLDGLKRTRSGFETEASNLGIKIHDTVRQQESELNDAWNLDTSKSDRATGVGDPDLTQVSGGASGVLTAISNASQTKRGNWRIKQSAIPNWYKHTTVRRTRLQSCASRAVWRMPETLRRPMKFF
ncbi:Sec-independent protein translocase protein TatB [Paraburkholderia madseniana]|uniref:Sec-independent protein translocase protein TatB n=1 Tax=Paraburkholderia madseniana TaxID=2599607 RepID=A0AAP5BDR6_9BURK|nr:MULTISPECIES: Sec-independent protein translocase protein TatB [Paraburkholderia]MCX4146251.1 Sec-independent protein translocase protein TatB [Paraburkholderia madseniana]MDN7149197.1 Sec-independent protein translocase protein TatB [Paraburkholderia sp. WS6]MDQ6408077.1 Sec-independent protein translocase protein TatB [Paraburkholderia madseniana]